MPLSTSDSLRLTRTCTTVPSTSKVFPCRYLHFFFSPIYILKTYNFIWTFHFQILCRQTIFINYENPFQDLLVFEPIIFIFKGLSMAGSFSQELYSKLFAFFLCELFYLIFIFYFWSWACTFSYTLRFIFLLLFLQRKMEGCYILNSPFPMWRSIGVRFSPPDVPSPLYFLESYFWY